MARLHHVVLIFGVSGAGKTTALRAFADAGFFVVDNLPVALVQAFVEQQTKEASKHSRVAILPHVERTQEFDQLIQGVASCSSPPLRPLIVFLDCRTHRIIARYSETRRPHPGFDPDIDKTISEAIERERTRLIWFKERAHLLIDSTEMSTHDLRRDIRFFADNLPESAPTLTRVNFLSFGFKYGVPYDCDIVEDLRFLPNPHFVEHLRAKDGLDPEVREYVLSQPDAEGYLSRYVSLLEFLLPRYINEGKSYVNIGIGCTGGKHRSVAIAEELQRRINHPGCVISAKHRDRGRE